MPHCNYRSHFPHILWTYILDIGAYICQTQPTVTSTSHHIAIHVPETNMATEFHMYDIYAKYLHAHMGYIYIYIYIYMNSLVSTM